MIVGIGIDSVEIKRFKDWHTKPRKSLERIFSEHEIEYCLSVQAKSAERFAARFTAKEAFLKALQPLYPNRLSLLNLCRLVYVEHTHSGQPVLQVNWAALNINTVLPTKPKVHLSISHTRTDTIASIIIEIDKY